MTPADEMAFVEFAHAARPRLRRTAYLLCGDWDRASDHLQEGLIRVYVARPRMRRTGGEHAYARRAVLSAFLDSTCKRSSKEYATQADSTVPSGEDDAELVTARRDEELVVGGFAIDGDRLVWSERANGVSNRLTVRDLETGEETSFDPRSGFTVLSYVVLLLLP